MGFCDLHLQHARQVLLDQVETLNNSITLITKSPIRQKKMDSYRYVKIK